MDGNLSINPKIYLFYNLNNYCLVHLLSTKENTIKTFGYISFEEKINYLHIKPVNAMIVYSTKKYVLAAQLFI